jgi:hypothetical protein
MTGYLHKLPISKHWEIRYESNSFTTTCLPVMEGQQKLLTNKNDVTKVNFEIEVINNIETARINR